MQPAPTGDPGNAPASYAIHTCAAVIFPSFVAPILQWIYEPEVGPVARSTSLRLIVILTGLPVFFDSNKASGSRYTVVFPPNPPPISAGITLILLASVCRRCPQRSRTAKAPWVLTQRVALPSVLYCATAL